MHDLSIPGVLQLDSNSQRSDRRLTLPPPPRDLLDERSDVVSVRSVGSSSSRSFELVLPSDNGTGVVFVSLSGGFDLVELVLERESLLLEGSVFVLEHGEASFGFVHLVSDGLWEGRAGREEQRREGGREGKVRRRSRRDETERRREREKRTSICCCLASFSALLSTANLAVSASICFW